MDKFKSALNDFKDKFQHPQPQPNNQPTPQPQPTLSTSPPQDVTHPHPPRLKWPPKLLTTHILGEIRDPSPHTYHRDIGRSIQLGHHTYYIFGDTFCFSSSGTFKGVTNNSIAHIPDPHHPTKSRYLSHSAKVPEFIPFTDPERRFCEDPTNKAENRRIVNWSFGGIVPLPRSHGTEGWLFYDQVETHGAEAVKQNGIGVAKVHVDPLTAAIHCHRTAPFPLFSADGPLWGNISNIEAPDGYTYLLSGVGKELGLDNYMARIRSDSDFTDRACYEFLHKGGEWKKTYEPPFGPFGALEHTVLSGQGQGAILHLPGFAPRGREYVWFGCEKFPTSRLCVGVAERPEGPWDVRVLGELPGVGEKVGTRYCVYPHVWGSRLGRGEVLISWSDDGRMGGFVAAAVFRFEVG
ncbi:hypothetical protein CC80DRAFT_498212 [Byssothecium circinans]|uniref:DUF4185 domain-containing protein n=1 Tax=Byssothecium circinans TaxID=147558 RepID=A0A6A5T8A8_9PLEO|nr:hypothetical protein CC80DRAFT_498212 [Byssothecium circinans]